MASGQMSPWHGDLLPSFCDFSDIAVACSKAEYGFSAFCKPPYLNPLDKLFTSFVMLIQYVYLKRIKTIRQALLLRL